MADYTVVVSVPPTARLPEQTRRLLAVFNPRLRRAEPPPLPTAPAVAAAAPVDPDPYGIEERKRRKAKR